MSPRPQARKKARRPDYTLWAAIDETSRGTVGCGWANANGSISLKINPFVVLPPDAKLMLYPQKGEPSSGHNEVLPLDSLDDDAPSPEERGSTPGDDIPF